MDLKDLPPRKDPKGGAKTPSGGISLREYQQQTEAPFFQESQATIWKMAASGFASLFVGMSIAWFTAMQGKGISRAEVEQYMRDSSPYARDKDTLALHNANQDEQIGKLIGGDERISIRLNTIDIKISTNEKDIADMKSRLEYLANYLEASKGLKR